MSVAVNNNTRVYFDPPVFGQIGPPAPDGRQDNYTYAEIQVIAKKLRDAGWDIRGIVVERKLYPSGNFATWDMAQPSKWGFISDVRSVAMSGQPYVPLKISWVNGTISNHWPEDLFLVEKSKTQFELEAIFKAQHEHDSPV